MIYTILSYIWFLAFIPFAFYSVIRLADELHMLQQNHYRNNLYWAWAKPNFRNHTKDLIILAAPVPMMILGGTVAELVALALWVIAFLLMIKNRFRVPAKNPLAFTDRAIRLYVLMLLVYFIPVVVILFAVVANQSLSDIVRGLFLLLLGSTPLLIPFAALLANRILQPWEKKQNRKSFAEARALLAEYPDLIKIAVAGSYGTTAVKHILERMLSEKYFTLMPAENSPAAAGIAKIIREELKPLHQVFLTETEAKQEGDIQELCDLISPKYGILTAVDKTNQDSVDSAESFINADFELIDALPENGIAAMNFDDENICINSNRMQGVVISYGINAKNLDFWAENIVYHEQGTEFTLCAKDGSKVDLRTRLLGRQNVYHIIGAAAMAVQLGISFKQIKRAVLTLNPVEHHLELKATANGVYLLDDSANTDSFGAEVALDILKTFTQGKKIFVTSGFVESDDKTETDGKKIGKIAAGICDYIVLIGMNQTEDLKAGIIEADFSVENILEAEYLDDTADWLKEHAQCGDCILFENDLPDLYFQRIGGII